MTILVGGPMHGEEASVNVWPLRTRSWRIDVGGQSIDRPSGCYRLDPGDARFATWQADDPSSLLAKREGATV